MPARYYLQALRDWASRVACERYPHHIAISVDSRVRLEAWLHASQSAEWMRLNFLSDTWNASPHLRKIGHCATSYGHLTITATHTAAHTIEINSIPPAAWRPRHALAWCVGKLLPGPAGWVVREVTL